MPDPQPQTQTRNEPVHTDVVDGPGTSSGTSGTNTTALADAGNAAVARMTDGGPTTPAHEPTPEERAAANLARYQDTLGKLLGTKLYKAVAPQVTPAATLALGTKLVDQLIALLRKQATTMATGDPNLSALVGPAMDLLQPLLKKYGQELLASPAGKGIAEALSNWVGTHPLAVASLVVLAAAGAVAADIDLPKLEQKFNVGSHIKAAVDVELGSIRHIAFEAIHAQIAYTDGPLSLTLDGRHRQDGSNTASLGFGLRQGSTNFTANGVLTEQNGKLNVTFDGGVEFAIKPQAQAVVQVGQDQHALKDGVSVGPDGRSLELGDPANATTVGTTRNDVEHLNAVLQTIFGSAGATTRLGAATGSSVDVGLKTRLRTYASRFGYKNEDEFERALLAFHDRELPGMPLQEFLVAAEVALGRGTTTTQTVDQPGGTGLEHVLSAGVSRNNAANTTGLRFGDTIYQSIDDGQGHVTRGRELLRLTLTQTFAPGGDSFAGSVNYNITPKMSVGGDFTLAKLSSYAVRFGYRDPEAFETALVEFRRRETPTVPMNDFAMTLEHTFGSMFGRLEAQITSGQGVHPTGAVTGMVAIPLRDNLKLLTGLSEGLGKDEGTSILAGVQIRRIPIVASYSQEKGFGIRVTVPFGRK